MNRIKEFALILGTSSLLLVLSFSLGNCWNTPGPAMMGMPPGQEFSPGPPPGLMGPPGPGIPPGPVPMLGPDPLHVSPPCGPLSDLSINVEGGVRAFYPTQNLKLIHETGPDLDFVEDLKFSRSFLTGEVYGALRLPPWLALTYTFRFPREDTGRGTLPTDLRIADVLFLAGDPIQIKSTTTVHRWEGELFVPFGCNFRAGPYVLGVLLVERLDVDALVDDATVTAFKTYTEFFPGVGGTAEFAPSHNFFIKGKAAYLFAQNLGGAYVDGEARFFPEFNRCGPLEGHSFRPYLGVGYRLRSAQFWREDQKLEHLTHGPYGSLGVVF